jgi:hypothetical protein
MLASKLAALETVGTYTIPGISTEICCLNYVGIVGGQKPD